MISSYIVPALFILSVVLTLIAIGHGFAARRHWRQRRRFACMHRSLWLVIFLALASISGGAGVTLRGYRLFDAEAPVATLDSRKLGPQWFAIRVNLPDGSHRSVQLHGDEWQIDARVIKWSPRAVMLGARPLYRLDRLSGRYRNADQARTTEPSIVSLGQDTLPDLWQIKQQFPQWLPWIDTDYGSAAYLPLVDGGAYTVSISPLGGLIARAANQSTRDKLKGSW